jgi:two-component system, NtrC family, response regulator
VATILIVDDEKNYLWMLEELLQGEGYNVLTCGKGSEALVRLAEMPIDLLLTDLKMAEMDGMALLAKMREISPATSAILMTAYGTVERAVEAMRLGAFDVVLKPFANADLLRTITRALERTGLVRENLRLSRALAGQYDIDCMIGQSTAMRAVLDKIRRVTDSKTTVFISGESGSGKELVARAIHFNGPRCGHPFVPVNCGALTDTLAESELFGHERGAFTSAMVRHAGLFEQANEGTLFLDEIGELSLATQTRLLRVLDRQEIRRVGSEKPVTVDVRILAATNRDLKEAVKTGKFREDLFYRLTVVRIEIPPLRERPEDIPLLAESCLQRLIKEGGVRGKVFSPSVVSLLTRYAWPGNVRELQNFVAHAALMAQSEEIQPEDFPIELVASDDWSASLDRILPDKAQLDETLKSIERHLIARALRQSQGVQARAAEMLGISRSLLQYKLKTFSPTPHS